MGKSQLRNVVLTALGCVAQEPPRSTLYPSPKKTSEYSRYGKLAKPGWPENSELVPPQPPPSMSSAPQGDAPAGCAPTSSGPNRRPACHSAAYRCASAGSVAAAHGTARLTPSP